MTGAGASGSGYIVAANVNHLSLGQFYSWRAQPFGVRNSVVKLKLSLITLLSLQTWLFWHFPYFPSQDGPAHLDTVSALLALNDGSSFHWQVYRNDWHFASNQIYHGIMYIMGQHLPLLQAEKLVLSMYGLLLVASIWYLIRSIGGRQEAILLALPVVFSDVLYLGFFNFCLALISGVLCIGLYFELHKHCTWQKTIALCILLLTTYFLHVFVLLIVLLAMILMSAIRVGITVRTDQESTNTSKNTLVHNVFTPTYHWLFAAVPALLLVINFLAFTRTDSSTESVSLLEQSIDFALLDGLDLMTKAYHAIVTFSLLDMTIQLPWLTLLFWLSLQAFRHRNLPTNGTSTDQSMNHSLLFVAFLVVLILIIILPVNTGPIVQTSRRLSPFLFIALTAYLSTSKLSEHHWQKVTTLAIFLVFAQLAYRFPAHANLNADIDEFVQAKNHIPAHSSVLPVILGGESHGYLTIAGQHLQFNPLLHATGYLVAQLPLINLRNYQLGYPYFPIQFAPDIPVEIGNYIRQKADTSFDLSDSLFNVFPPVSTLILWGDIHHYKSEKWSGEFAKKLETLGFKESFRSQRSLLRVFNR